MAEQEKSASSQDLSGKAAKGAVWSTIDRFGMMVLIFSVNLVLARLLTPADFGIIGMLAIFMSVSQVFVDGGFGSALIQKKQPSQSDYSTVFYWNLMISIGLYICLFIISPWVGEFYRMPLLSSVLRGIGLTLIVSSVYTIQMTRLRKQMNFKKLAVCNLTSYFTGGLVGIGMAFNGFGVWSLVGMQIGYYSMGVVLLAVVTRWLPSWSFSKSTVKELFGFGGFILGANILQEISKNIQGVVIGRKFSAAQMGLYSQAHKFDSVTSNTLPLVVGQVMYPVFSELQFDKVRLAAALSKSVRLISFLSFPLIGLLIIIAEPLIGLLYGDKWIPCTAYYRIFCIGGFFTTLININFYVVAALGYSKTLFKWSFYKWGFLLTGILVGMNFGIDGIIWAVVLSNINIYFVNSCLACRQLGVSLISQVKDWGRNMVIVFLSGIMAVGFSMVTGFSPWISGLVFVIAFAVLVFFLNRDDFSQAKDISVRLLGKIR